MSGPAVFISYSHKDEVWKDQLLGQLRVLELEGDLSVWNDRKIAAGDEWRAQIETAMENARAAVLLISADFLISKFIRGTEVPRLLQLREKEGLRIIPLIVRPCAWRRVPWLAEIQGRPKDGKALSKSRKAKVEEDLAALAEEIADLLQAARGHQGLETPGYQEKIVPEGTTPPRRPLQGSVFRQVSQGFQSLADSAGPGLLLDLGRLPIPGPTFVGRESELARPLYDRGSRLAYLIRKERSLLILDGIEPLQYPLGRPEIEGRLKALQTSPRHWRSPSAAGCGCMSATRTSNGRGSAGTRGISLRRGGMWRGHGSW
jgi:hypothetical protein